MLLSIVRSCERRKLARKDNKLSKADKSGIALFSTVDQPTGDDQMQRQSDNSVVTPIKHYPEIEAEIQKRQQQRQQTLAWISTNAASTLRGAWHKALHKTWPEDNWR
jgi:hypothetical protein